MKKWIVVFVVALALVAFSVKYIERNAARGDCLFYFDAGDAILANADPYAGSSLAHAGYLCAPFFALVMVPFGLMPRVVAASLWFVFNFGSLILLFSVSFYLLESPAVPIAPWLRRKLANLGRGKWNWVLVATAVVSARLWWDNLGSGQINVPLWALAFLGVYFVQRGNKVTGGAVMGAAVLAKLTPASLLLYLVIRREYRALLSVVIAAAVLCLGSAVFLGWSRNAYLNDRWCQVVFRPAVTEYYCSVIDRNESMPAALSAYGRMFYGEHLTDLSYLRRHFRWVNALTVGLFASAIAFFVVKCGFAKRRAGPAASDNLLLALIVLTGVLLQPLAWLQHFVVAIFPYMAVLYYSRRTGPGGARYACYALVALSFAAHSLTTADIWGPATEDAFFRLKIITISMLLLYAAVVIQLIAACRRRRLPAPLHAGRGCE